MSTNKKLKRVYKLTFIALAVSLLTLFAFIGAIEGGNSESKTAFMLIFMILLFFLSLPLHLYLTISTLLYRKKYDNNPFRWIYFYLVITISCHVAVAGSMGAFSETTEEINRFIRTIDNPAQVKLENMLKRFNANVDDVQDALNEGANPNGYISYKSKNHELKMPFLIQAVANRDFPATKALINAGANPNVHSPIKHESGVLVLEKPHVLDISLLNDDSESQKITELLLTAGSETTQSIMKLTACRRGDIALYQRATKLGINQTTGNNNYTCLHLAASTNRAAFIEKLYSSMDSNKEDLNQMLSVRNMLEQFPLDVALYMKNYQAALQIAKIGGTANTPKNIEYALKEKTQEPHLLELQKILSKLPLEK